MIYLQDDNDYDTDDDNLNEFENEYESYYINKLYIVNNYKKLLSLEPEFIGIKNIRTCILLHIIENTKILSFNKNDYKINNDQHIIFNRLYNDLDIEGSIDIYNTVTNKIFKYIYV